MNFGLEQQAIHTSYLPASGILEMQEQFVSVQPRDSNGNIIPFTNVLDKGYRLVVVAWRAGGQFGLQPAFAKSDRKFTSNEVLKTSSVAHGRSGNERVVGLSKMAGYIKRGLQNHQSTSTLADMWLVWGFRCNFMFRPVLQTSQRPAGWTDQTTKRETTTQCGQTRKQLFIHLI